MRNKSFKNNMLPRSFAGQPARIVIATRESALAMWQARHIESRLAEYYPHISISILGMTTEGDRKLGTSLAKIGGKGLFVKSWKVAPAAGRADIAVHSPAMPMHLPEGFALGAIRILTRDARVVKLQRCRRCRPVRALAPRVYAAKVSYAQSFRIRNRVAACKRVAQA
jgi:hypothetical protein